MNLPPRPTDSIFSSIYAPKPISPEERRERLRELRGLMAYLDEQSRVLGLNERYVRLRERLESRIIL